MNRAYTSISRTVHRRMMGAILATALAGFGFTALAQVPPPPPPIPSQAPIATSRLAPEGDALEKFQTAAKAVVAKSAGAKFQIFVLLPPSTDVDENVQNLSESQATGEKITAALGKVGVAADHVATFTLPGQDVPAAQVRLYTN